MIKRVTANYIAPYSDKGVNDMIANVQMQNMIGKEVVSTFGFKGGNGKYSQDLIVMTPESFSRILSCVDRHRKKWIKEWIEEHSL